MILIIDCGSSKTAAIKDVVSACGFSYTIVKLPLLSPDHIAKAKGMIISGSPILLSESYPVLFAQRFSFIKNSSIPILGICFGHQILGLVFGETVFRGEDVQREEEINFMFDDALTNGIPQRSFFREDHTEGIGLPDDDFFLLASSAQYEVEAMKHKKATIYGVQFHPEVSGELGKKLLSNFCAMCF